ncbi:cytochrome P450 monooxygenase 59 [Ancistrocladus abbreviatus]
MSVMVVTSLGDIVIDLHTDRCPLTCKNFLKLCKIKYYNGCLFHTVQKDFTAQTGDLTGTGTGGDSIYKFLYGDQARFFSDEVHLDLKHSKLGTVAMASAGENLNASQFYITLRNDLDYLDGKHTVFGEVAEGQETLMRINEAYVDEKGRPYKNIRIKHTYVLDDPFEDPPQLAGLIPDGSPEGKPKEEVDDEVRLEDDWVPMDEQMDVDELEEVIRTKEAHSRAVVLESIGDIPDADIKPPENVLFVCKLNPVTEDEDLHTIFSRFGTVTSAEVIRDYKTGDSLCYAFIEFENKEACEQAYFKMDNALIDDRRIHVDFSQSVAKLWNQFRRKGSQQGRGCFKCGALDHNAKDCTEGSTVKQQQKYTLKDDNRQHGGGDNARYEMVFDEDDSGSPKREKKPRDREKDDQMRSRRNLRDDKRRDYVEESSDRYRQGDRSRKGPETNDRSQGQTSDTYEGAADRERHARRQEGRTSMKRDEKDYSKRSEDRHSHGALRDEKDYRKRTWESNSPGDRRDHGDYKRKNVDTRREKRDDYSNRQRDPDGDGHRSRREEHDNRRRSEVYGDHDHDRHRRYDDRRR